MKLILTFLIWTCAVAGFAQNEFGETGQDLLYSDRTIGKLKSIVDSLNLKFKVCELNKVYKAKSQAIGHYVSLSDIPISEAKQDLEANISYEDFKKKYPTAETVSDLLIVKFDYKNYKGQPVIEFSSLELAGKYHHQITFTGYQIKIKPSKNSWLISHQPANKYSKESLCAFFIKDAFKQNQIPLTYAKMIQYADCMIDTATQVFYENASKDRWRSINNKLVKAKLLDGYVSARTVRTKGLDVNDKDFYKKLDDLDKIKKQKIDSLYKNDPQFSILLKEATEEALKNHNSNEELEELVQLYYSKETALELKRHRIVVGMCSMDDSPRKHAMKIAMLSAETAKWEVFLRSHLDIMNDKFDRMSDGSYAQAMRQTYIKELEVLDINVLDLLLGISLRVENPSINHYNGSINRLGRALSETKDNRLIEEKMLSMISDNQLDDYNRMLIYYLFLNYNYSLTNKDTKVANVRKLDTAIKTLPDYLAGRLGTNKEGK
ncbi:hypothetical protein [Pedobacter sp.]|uniref:hypothetical protein n=1 Tax=Pedobacter sp. TaxID=1411316 RepID=UPI003BA984FA